MSFLNRLNNNSLKITVFFVVAIQLILAFQGFDVCDDGFAVTFYQQFFNDADSVEYNFVYWLSGLVGGAWYEIFGWGGVFSFRILAILVNTGTLILTFRMLKPYINKTFLLLALSMTIFINDFGYLAFYNNHITAFLAVLSIYWLHRGLVKDNFRLLFLAGLIIGFNVFSRLPNLSLYALVCSIPIWYGFNKLALRTMIKPLALFNLGFFVAFGFVYIILKSLGQFEIMQRAILSLFDIGGTEQSSHNVSSLLKIYFRNYLKIGFYFISILLALFVISKTDRKISANRPFYWILLTLVFVISLQWFRVSYIHGFYALGYVGVLLVGFTTKMKEVRLLAILAFILQILLPFGSGGGITSIGYASLWLSLPLFFYVLQLWSQGSQNFTQLPFKLSTTLKPYIKVFTIVFMMAFALVKLYRFSKMAYFDPGSRFDKTYSINSAMAKGIYTTKERASVLNEVLEVLPLYAKPNDYLLIYDKTPMLHFLTETKPYMYNSWPWIYDSVSFKKKLNQALINREELPVVVIQKFETIGSFSAPNDDYLSTNIEENYFHNNAIAKTMQDFLDDQNYVSAWSSSHFEIFIPKNSN